MKLKNRKSTKVAAKSPTNAKTGRVFSKDNIDLIPFMVTPRVPQRAIITGHRNKPMPKKDPTHTGYLIATGTRGTYISEVLTDDGVFYAREKRVGGIAYGQIDLLPKQKDLTLEIVDQDELLARCKKLGRVVTFTRSSDKKDVTAALVSTMDGNIMSGVIREGKDLKVLTMHSAGKSLAPLNEQYGNPRNHKAGKAFLAALTK